MVKIKLTVTLMESYQSILEMKLIISLNVHILLTCHVLDFTVSTTSNDNCLYLPMINKVGSASLRCAPIISGAERYSWSIRLISVHVCMT